MMPDSMISICHFSKWCLSFALVCPLSQIIDNYPWKRSIKNTIFSLLKLCLATGTQNFKWVAIYHIYLIWYQTIANLDVETHISFPVTMIQSANKT